MPVFKRRLDERVLIGDPAADKPLLEIHVIRAGPGWVQLGFVASEGLQVHREEVWERIRREGRQSKP